MNNSKLYPEADSKGRPLFDSNGNLELSPAELDEMQRELEQKYAEIFDILRIDRNDSNSTRTPQRLAKMWVRELYAGRLQSPLR